MPHREGIGKSKRLGPNPPAALVALQKQTFEHVLSASGLPAVAFHRRGRHESARISLRRWHLSTVLPLARILEHELTMRLETDVKLKFDTYALDMAGRAQAFAKLVCGWNGTRPGGGDLVVYWRWRNSDCEVAHGGRMIDVDGA